MKILHSSDVFLSFYYVFHYYLRVKAALLLYMKTRREQNKRTEKEMKRKAKL